MTLKWFAVISALGLAWTAIGIMIGGWPLIPLAASYTAMLATLSATDRTEQR
jgi:hypothetical protein